MRITAPKPSWQRLVRSVLAVLAVVGVGGGVVGVPSAAPAQVVTIKYLEWITPQVGEPAMKSIIDAFQQAHPDIQVERITMPFGPVHDKVIVLNAAKDLPDVINMNLPWTIEFARAGILEPLNSYLRQADAAWVHQLVKAPMMPWKGNVYLLPLTSIPFVLFYNTDLLHAAGYSAPPRTWDEWRAMAVKMTIPAQHQYGMAGTLADKSPYNGAAQEVYPLIYQQGAMTLKNGRANINSPQAVKAVQFFVDLVNKYRVYAPGTLTNMESDKVEAFAAGQIGFMVENVAFVSTLRSRNANLHFAVAPLPKGVTTGTRLTGWNLGLSAQSAHKAAAWAFMQYLTSPQTNATLAAAAQQLPGNLAATYPAMLSDPMLKVAAAVMKDPRVMAEDAVTPQYTDLQRILVEHLQAALQNQTSVQQAMNDAAAGWNAILAKY